MTASLWQFFAALRRFFLRPTKFPQLFYLLIDNLSLREYNATNINKPLSKRSTKKYGCIQRAAGWCECGSTVFWEWTCEGVLENRAAEVDANGNLVRYQ
jgi:hypothetical protein